MFADMNECVDYILCFKEICEHLNNMTKSGFNRFLSQLNCQYVYMEKSYWEQRQIITKIYFKYLVILANSITVSEYFIPSN